MTTTAAKNDNATAGSKHIRGRDVSLVAKDIRADIKALMPTIKASVKLSRYSMGQSIRVEITDVPVGMTIISTRRVREDLGLAKDDSTPYLSAAGAHIVAAICRHGTDLVCALPDKHAGTDHNTSEDGSGDSFPVTCLP